jgi:hypothetical protein
MDGTQRDCCSIRLHLDDLSDRERAEMFKGMFVLAFRYFCGLSFKRSKSSITLKGRSCEAHVKMLSASCCWGHPVFLSTKN